MKNLTTALPTNEELTELLEINAAEHTAKSENCQVCLLKSQLVKSPEYTAVVTEGIVMSLAGLPAIFTLLSHFFRAGMTWQEKQSAIYRDTDELSRLFSVCDDRPENK